MRSYSMEMSLYHGKELAVWEWGLQYRKIRYAVWKWGLCYWNEVTNRNEVYSMGMRFAVWEWGLPYGNEVCTVWKLGCRIRTMFEVREWGLWSENETDGVTILFLPLSSAVTSPGGLEEREAGCGGDTGAVVAEGESPPTGRVGTSGTSVFESGRVERPQFSRVW